ncbi:MAG: hypothetical protein BGN85_07750 [Alphaproteobacteria bacterium 64-11]|nr:MAG: hypothetical protein BGN85_07750 [Alphaproteobacteria bacterium 64-11]
MNLAFSSIEEERRDAMIANCYWPLLKLAAAHGPLGMEISGYTLEEISARDPAWIEAARAAIARGEIELIGSGYSQMIGPLVPARVTRENLRLGLEVYQRLLGMRPRLALVNEQAYAGGLVGLYADAGFDALIMDFDNPASQHPEWHGETAFLPQYAVGPDGRRIALLWSNTAAFQQLQRLAHGDTGLDVYRDFVRGKARAQSARALCLYASDAEIFDFRPGRFKTEEKLSGGEWDRLAAAFAAVREDGAAFVAPSRVLDILDRPGAGQALVLESAACPVPVKKQRKYNLARWAVTGRDNLAVNAACERIYRGMAADESKADWKELCYLWASDFRTHLTGKRWTGFAERLKAADARWGIAAAGKPAPLSTPAVADRHIDIKTATLSARLDRRRGLALSSLHFSGHARPVLGGLPHGFFGDIALQADWYTGDCVWEAPGEHKTTDLDWADTRIAENAAGDVLVEGHIQTPRGTIEKRMRFCGGSPRVEFDLLFNWSSWDKGVLRLGHFTLLPDAFDFKRLWLSTNNGGAAERFALAGQTIDHGAPVSFLVSSSFGLGMTEGWAEISDGRAALRVEVDRCCAPLLGLLTHRPARRADGTESLFCQLQLSALELDDTRKPADFMPGSRRFRFCVSAA